MSAVWIRLLLFLIIIPSILPAACLQPKPGSPPAPSITALAQPQAKPATVPAEYQYMFTELMRKLDDFDSRISSQTGASVNRVTLAAELLTANSNIGEGLLSDANFQANRVYLDALQAINVTGVQVSIMYPLLTPGFPSADKYLVFYKKLMQELRSRNMTVLVKIGNPFANSVYSDLKISFEGLTLDKYRAGKKAMVNLVAGELKPDYLTICNEPSTEKITMGLLQSPVQYAETVRYVLDGLDRGKILIGGGAGTWDALAYMTCLADCDLDYLDAHVYPLDFLNRFIDIAGIAHAKNKRLVIGEAWVYKLNTNELIGLGNIAATSRIYSRDVFSFWEPVDSKFLTVLVKMAGIYGYEFVAPFWSTCLFGYIDYNDSTKGLDYRKLRQESNRAAYQNMLQKKPSGSGLIYSSLGR